MNRRHITLLIIVALVLSGCYGNPPKPGSTVITMVWEVWDERIYERRKKQASQYYGDDIILSAIAEGVTPEDVQQGRFVVCACECGADCIMYYPVLLTKGVSLKGTDLVELETGRSEYNPSIHSYIDTLSKFRRHIDIHWSKYPIKETEGYPECTPDKWPK